MKIMMVNKFFYIKGGSETYYFALKRLLESKGHTVVDFSMKDEKNYYSPYSNYFVENIDYAHSAGIKGKVKAGCKIIYSFEAKKKFESLVIKEKPDLIHLHIFQHQISPSILDVIKKYNIPTVYTAHDLKMVCLNYKMMHDGKICEDCKDGHYYHCIKNKCVKNSYLKSCVNFTEGVFHRWKKSYDVIDVIITPSKFYKEKFEQFGIDSSRIVHLANFLDRKKPLVNESNNKGKYYLYLGRLSEEKGIFTLIKAFENVNIPLYIAGTGPLSVALNRYAKNKHLDNIKLLGFKKDQELIDLVGNSKAVILPSEWYENGPYSAIEALQLGRPIIGANIGGIPELINNNGLLFKCGSAEDLANKVEIMENLSPLEYLALEKASYKLFETTYTAQCHYPKLMEIYNMALKRKSIED